MIPQYWSSYEIYVTNLIGNGGNINCRQLRYTLRVRNQRHEIKIYICKLFFILIYMTQLLQCTIIKVKMSL